MLRFVVAFLSLLPGFACAAPQDLLPEDFAVGQQIRTVGQAPFYRLRLPEAVYTGVANEDLRDLRVFNNRGESVPFSLLAPPSLKPVAQINVDLRAFSLPEAERTAEENGIVSYDEGRMQLSWSRNASQSRPQLLLVAPDAEGSIGSTLSALELNWADTPSSWQQTVTLESSDDLSEWTVVAAKQPLMDLRENGQRLKISRISFPTTRARYWRLTLSQGQAPTLSRVEGVHEAQSDNQDRVWLRPEIVESPSAYQRTYRFPAVISAELVRVGLPQANSVVPMNFEYRDNPDAAWQPLIQTVAWRLPAGASGMQGEQSSPPVPVSLARILELRLTAGSGGWGPGEPQIELGRSALYLIFNARGADPFLLAWGSAAAQHEALDPYRLVPRYSESSFYGLPEAQPTRLVTLGGEQRRFEAGLAERQARWRSRLLWILLLTGVAGLAALAWRLWRETRNTPPPNREEQ